jgi:hypothetical protein
MILVDSVMDSQFDFVPILEGRIRLRINSALTTPDSSVILLRLWLDSVM